jgi:hypothetical protein
MIMATDVIYGVIAFVALVFCLHLFAFGTHLLCHLLRLIGHILLAPWLVFDLSRRETTARPPAEHPRNLRMDGSVQFRILHPFGRQARYWLAGTGFQTPLISVAEYRRMSHAQRLEPVCVHQQNGLSWWWYNDRFWHASGHDPADVPGMIRESTQVL